jgi:peptide deformylase
MSNKKGKAKANARKKKRQNSQHNQEAYRKKFLGKILKWDEPILSEQCATVEKDEDVKKLIKDMGRVLSFSKYGVGLAAPQIGVAKRVIVAKIGRGHKFFINPEIKIHDGNIIKSRESCLSYPGVEAVIDRNDKITVDYEDENRNHHIEEFSGFEAIVLAHEIDHTFGICKVGQEWKRLNTPAPVVETVDVEEEEYDEPVKVESSSSEE